MGGGSAAGPETMEKSRPPVVATSDDRREAVEEPEQKAAARVSTPRPRPEAACSREEEEEGGDGRQAESAREKLKRHRRETAGRVWVPELWGQEKLLKGWTVDCSAFDRPLVPPGLLAARRALVAESCKKRRPSPAPTPPPSATCSNPLRLQNGCSS